MDEALVSKINPQEPPMSNEIEVIQADRDAAADYMGERDCDWGYCGDVREGRAEHPLPKFFARHRIESARNARVEALSEAEKVASDAGDRFHKEWREGLKSSSYLEGKSDGASEVAEVIESLKTKEQEHG